MEVMKENSLSYLGSERVKNIFKMAETKIIQLKVLAPVVRRLDNAIHRINRYPADKR